MSHYLNWSYIIFCMLILVHFFNMISFQSIKFRFQYNQTIEDWRLWNGAVGQTTGDLYILGSYGLALNTVIQKNGRNNYTVDYEFIYSYGSSKYFELSPDESILLYTRQNSTNAVFTKLNATNGQIISTFQLSGSLSAVSKISDDNQYWYLCIQDIIQGQLLVCQLDLGNESTLNWIRYTNGLKYWSSIDIIVDDSVLFLAQDSSTATDNSAYFIYLDFSRTDLYELWQQKFNASLDPTSYLDSSAVLPDFTNNVIKIYVAYNQILHYFTLSIADGSLSSSTYESSFCTANNVNGFVETRLYDYLSLKCATSNIIFEYTTSTSAFSRVFTTTLSTSVFERMISGTNSIFFLGYYDGSYEECYLHKAESIDNFNNEALYSIVGSDVVPSVYSMQLIVNSLYEFEQTNISGSVESLSITSVINDAAQSIEYKQNNISTSISDVMYFGDYIEYLNLTEK